MMKKDKLVRLLITAILLAVGMVLPLFLGQVKVLGQAISPLHIPVLICGLTCGWPWGMALGFILPLFRSLVFGMPPLVPGAVCMAFEMAAYGFLTGLLYPMFRKMLGKKILGQIVAMLIAMVIAMVAGRVVGGIAKVIVLGFQGKSYTFNAFVTAYFAETAIGAVIHLIVVPAIVIALEKAKLSPLARQFK